MALMTKKLHVAKNGTEYKIDIYSSLSDIATTGNEQYLPVKVDGVGQGYVQLSSNLSTKGITPLRIKKNGVTYGAVSSAITGTTPPSTDEWEISIPIEEFTQAGSFPIWFSEPIEFKGGEDVAVMLGYSYRDGIDPDNYLWSFGNPEIEAEANGEEYYFPYDLCFQGMYSIDYIENTRIFEDNYGIRFDTCYPSFNIHSTGSWRILIFREGCDEEAARLGIYLVPADGFDLQMYWWFINNNVSTADYLINVVYLGQVRCIDGEVPKLPTVIKFSTNEDIVKDTMSIFTEAHTDFDLSSITV